MSTSPQRRLAVVGGGWAGIAAAVDATRRGHAVTLFEMAPQLGGRSRGLGPSGHALDNGQHILIGAYVETLALLETVGVSSADAFLRTPLSLSYPDGSGLRLRPGAALPAFAAAVLRRRGWSLRDRLRLLAAAGGWAARGFRCQPALSVAALTRDLPAVVRDQLIEPLCVAALNTPSRDASASVFLRVLRDALFAAPGSADLLLPRLSLSALLPEPGARWLGAAGATVRLAQRVVAIAPQRGGWSVDGDAFDRVVLAASPVEAARLAAPHAPEWSRLADTLRHEPIVTVYLRGDGLRLSGPMLALHADPASPAQFVLDRGQLGGPEGLLAFVISGAQPWVDRGMSELRQATIDQAHAALGQTLQHVQTVVEKRATFRCTPGLVRPPLRILDGLHASGDYVEGPYPATLEGAVRSGQNAVRAFE